jgi:predicted SprT family Zn-dependent metalloprotease
MSKSNIEVTFKKIEEIRNEPFQKQKICFLCDKNSTHYVRINYIDDGGSVYICGNCIKKIYNKMEGIE